MIRIYLLGLVLFVAGTLSLTGQILEPVKWFFSSEKTGGNEVILKINASIDDTWHLYSKEVIEDGPFPTTITFVESPAYELVGETGELPEPEEEYDDLFGRVLKFFSDQATFTQKILVHSADSFEVRGALEFMVCDSKQCLPPTEVDFVIPLGGVTLKKSTVARQSDSVSEATVKSNADKAPVQAEQKPAVQEIVPEEAISEEEVQGGTVQAAENDNTPLIDLLPATRAEKRSLWSFFIISFFAGLAAILTPCVFPMIPMTVSFFLKSNKSRAKAKLQAFFYGFSIVVIYTIIGTVVALTLGANFANFLSTHWLPNILFFLVFVVFAASFFGMFEINLPNWMITRSDNNADKGGLVGAFFMAFTIVLVSFSCTGPIVGALLVASAGGEILEPVVGMFGFSLAFAFPFTLFAFFPGWLNGLPKSGSWLNSVKVVLGFIELALGLKFLSIADQTYHWGILDREVYLALWIAIFTFLGFYLLGKLRFHHDSKLEYISVPRLILAILTFGFVIYMLPGMNGAPLKALAGYLPPMSTLDFNLSEQNNAQDGQLQEARFKGNVCEPPLYGDLLKLPHGLVGYFDYEQGMECAQELNKPVFIDFTGHGCVNCREMEANVWSAPGVLERLRKDYVIIALYVDDKTRLPEDRWFTSDYDGRVKKTIGKSNADFQISRFQVNAQPYYVLLDNAGELLIEPRAYDLDIENFISFLDEGKREFRRRRGF